MLLSFASLLLLLWLSASPPLRTVTGCTMPFTVESAHCAFRRVCFSHFSRQEVLFQFEQKVASGLSIIRTRFNGVFIFHKNKYFLAKYLKEINIC